MSALPMIALRDLRRAWICGPNPGEMAWVELFRRHAPQTRLSLGDIVQTGQIAGAATAVDLLPLSQLETRRALVAQWLLPALFRITAEVDHVAIRDAVNDIDSWCLDGKTELFSAEDSALDIMEGIQVAHDAEIEPWPLDNVRRRSDLIWEAAAAITATINAIHCNGKPASCGDWIRKAIFHIGCACNMVCAQRAELRGKTLMSKLSTLQPGEDNLDTQGRLILNTLYVVLKFDPVADERAFQAADLVHAFPPTLLVE